MSVTSNLGSFNKDKVANKFGIQLKNKNTNAPTQQAISPTNDKKISSVTKNNTICDFRSQDQPNFDSAKSNVDQLSITTTNEQRRTSLNINSNHSTDSNSQLLLLQSSDNKKSSSISPSVSRRTSQSKTPERPIIPTTTTTTKTEEEIEHQKDQPLYKRQLSKTLDNNTSTTTKSKHPYELPNSR